MDKDVLSKLENIRNYCNNNCKDSERWTTYFDRRYLEFLSYLELLPKKHFDNILELGCGAGYQSSFLAQIAGKVIATDLLDENMDTHTPGMVKAENLNKNLHIYNVEFVGCSAESLPFPDQYFDLVYSSHVLEHVPDQNKALKEIFRVLKPNGLNICVVPTSFEKLYSFLNYYLYLLKRSFIHFANYLSKEKIINGAKSKSENNFIFKKSVASQFKYFPFPPPHGHYPHFLMEFISWTPKKWRKRIEYAANFKLVQQSTTQFNPLLPLLGVLSPKFGTYAHSITRKVELKLGEWKLFQWIGVNSVMIFRKEVD